MSVLKYADFSLLSVFLFELESNVTKANMLALLCRISSELVRVIFIQSTSTDDS